MNRDDIIRMARQAGMKACCGRTDNSGKHHPTVNALFSTVPVQWLEQFANLVASEEREACAKLVADTPEWRGNNWFSTLCPQTKGAICDAIRGRGQQ